jgi:ABC-type transport system substrate-binding protein
MVGTAVKAMDPSSYGSDDASDLVYRFLLRGLIRYDIASGVYTGDLANCDLADMTSIVCTLRNDTVWSDGTRIKADDIIASIEMYKRTATNKDIRSLLQ